MARYRNKDETDLTWNRIRRGITTELDLQIKNWREDTLNRLLSDAWIKYAQGLEKGEIRELEPKYAAFVRQALEDAITLEVPEQERVA